MNGPQAAFATLLLLCGCNVSLAEQTLTVKRESFPALGVARARFEAGAGFLVIQGRLGVSAIEVTAEFKGRAGSPADEQRILENLKLTMEVRGDTFHLKTEQREGWRWGRSGWIDVTVILPPKTTLDVVDGSGSLSISGIDGDVTIDDGSGEVNLDRIQGTVEVKDGSGSIEIRDVGKNVRIEDGSGGITVRHVQGDVRIEDGSGSIEVEDVGGSLDVPSAGSGSVRYRDVRGTVRVPRRGRD